MKTTEANIEIDEYKVIEKIDKKHEFYLGKPDLCKPDQTNYTIKSLEKCDNFKNICGSNAENASSSTKTPDRVGVSKEKLCNTKLNATLNTLSLIIMDNGGVNLSEYVDTIKEKTREDIRVFFIELRRIFMGIKAFLQNSTVHHDLKPQNFVYNETNNRINIIDFGMMSSFEKIIKESKQSNNWLSRFHWSFPLEIEFYNRDKFMKYARLSVKEKHKFYSKILSNLKLKNIESKIIESLTAFFEYTNGGKYGNEFMNNYLKDFYETLLYEIVPENYENFLKKSMVTIDIYGTGLAFIWILNNCSDKMSESAYTDFHKLFANMVSSDINKRYNIDELTHKYDSLLIKHEFMPSTRHNNISMKLYKKINSIRKKHVSLTRKQKSDLSLSFTPKCFSKKSFNNKTQRCIKQKVK